MAPDGSFPQMVSDSAMLVVYCLGVGVGSTAVEVCGAGAGRAPPRAGPGWGTSVHQYKSSIPRTPQGL